MKENINTNLENLRKEVWTLAKTTLANIEEQIESLDATGIQTIQSRLQSLEDSYSDLSSLPSSVSSLSTSITSNTTEISSLQENKVDKVEGKGLSSNDFTTTEKTKLQGIAEGANNYILASDIATTSSIPTSLSQLSDDSSHRTVSDSEKSTWNGKCNSSDLSSVATSGSYNDLTDKPIISLSLSGSTLTINI